MKSSGELRPYKITVYKDTGDRERIDHDYTEEVWAYSEADARAEVRRNIRNDRSITNYPWDHRRISSWPHDDQ